MSALSAIAQYSSDSEGDEVPDKDTHTPHQLVGNQKKVRLPTASVVLRRAVVASEQHRDEPAEHGGRVRAFSHERGNWATFVYVPLREQDSEYIGELIAQVSEGSTQQLELCSDLHVSLSRTIVLRYHWINTFTTTLQHSLRDVECVELELNSVKIYCNDEQTRTFIALTVDHFTSRELKKITEKVDAALEEFRLPKYYVEPSFHVSVLWCNGNKILELEEIHRKLQNILTQNSKSLTFAIDRIVCKCGNKLFHFPLKY